MRWRHGRRSTNIENRQRVGGKTKAAGGGIGLILLALIVGYMGGDPAPLLQEGVKRTFESSFQGQPTMPEEEIKELSEFVSVILASTEDVWGAIYAAQGKRYPPPKLVLFTSVVNSACGRAGSATGPFYCTRDQKIYIDISFYRDLKEKMNAPGDFAQAYVIAHEVGHHVQNVMGVIDAANKLKARLPKIEANKVSVRTELQADCLSGIWAKRVQEDYNIILIGVARRGTCM